VAVGSGSTRPRLHDTGPDEQHRRGRLAVAGGAGRSLHDFAYLLIGPRSIFRRLRSSSDAFCIPWMMPVFHYAQWLAECSFLHLSCLLESVLRYNRDGLLVDYIVLMGRYI
jgi:hypothetical protein